MNNNQPNYYGHHISSINLSFIELESASQQVRLAQAKPGSSVRVRGCLAIFVWGILLILVVIALVWSFT